MKKYLITNRGTETLYLHGTSDDIIKIPVGESAEVEELHFLQQQREIREWQKVPWEIVGPFNGDRYGD